MILRLRLNRWNSSLNCKEWHSRLWINQQLCTSRTWTNRKLTTYNTGLVLRSITNIHNNALNTENIVTITSTILIIIIKKRSFRQSIVHALNINNTRERSLYSKLQLLVTLINAKSILPQHQNAKLQVIEAILTWQGSQQRIRKIIHIFRCTINLTSLSISRLLPIRIIWKT